MHFEPPGGVRVCLSHGFSPLGLQTDFLGHHLAVHIGVAVEHLALFGAPEVELQVVFLGEADTAVNLMRLAQTRRQASLVQALAMAISLAASSPLARHQAAR